MIDAEAHPRFKLIPGIVGGLGPYGHLHLEHRLLALTAERFGAAADADFPEWIVSSVPQTPDRTAALAGDAPDPTPFLLRSLRRLGDAGADFAAIACNTIHAFLPAMAAAGQVPLPIVHAVTETAGFLRREWPTVRRVGLLATTGTCRSGLFDAAFADAGIEVVAPPEDVQEGLVMTAIYGPADAATGRRAGGIKGGLIDQGDPSPRTMLHQAGGLLVERHRAEAIVVGCSEISPALAPGDVAVPVVDTMDVLAEAVLDLASGRRGLDSLPGSDRWPAPRG